MSKIENSADISPGNSKNFAERGLYSLPLGNLPLDNDLYPYLKINRPLSGVLHNPQRLLSINEGTKYATEGTIRDFVKFLGDIPHPNSPLRLGVGVLSREGGDRRGFQLECLETFGESQNGGRLPNLDLHTTNDVLTAARETVARLVLDRRSREDTQLLIFDPERDFWTELKREGLTRLSELSYEDVAGVPRLEGWKLAQEAGAKTPEEIVVIGDEVFRRYCKTKALTPEDRENITRAAGELTRSLDRVAVRRALTIPHYPLDPGGTRGFINPDDWRRSANIVGDIYKEALSLIGTKGQELAEDSQGEITQKIWKEAKVYATLQRFVDPISIKLVDNGEEREVEIRPDQRLPTGASAVPLDEEATLIRVKYGYGNNRGLAGEGNAVTLKIDPEGKIYPLNPRELVETRPQDKMFCTVGGEETWLPVPQQRKDNPPFSLGELENIARIVRKMHLLAVEKGLDRTHYRIEVSMGWGFDEQDTSALYPYVTQAAPYNISKELFSHFEGEGLLLVVGEEGDLVQVEEALKLLSQEQLFVGIPSQLVIQNSFLAFRLISLLKGKEGVTALVGTDYATAHIVTNLMAEGIACQCVQDFPLEAFTGSRIRYEKESGLSFRIEKILPGDKRLLSLEEAWQFDPRESGPKAYNLSLLAREGFNTVPGGVLVKGQFEEILKRLDLEGLFSQLRGLDRNDRGRARELAGQIKRGLSNIPPDIMRQIRNQVEGLFGDRIPDNIIVRSSASAEDSAKPAAGVFESIGGRGDLTLEGLERAIIEVYHSLFSDEAIDYIFDNVEGNLDQLANLAMSVVIQEYVPIRKNIDYSFVMFTAEANRPNAIRLSIGLGPCADIVEGVGEGGDIIFDRNTGNILESNWSNDGAQIGKQAANLIIEQGIVRHMERICGTAADIEGALIRTNSGQFIPIFYQVRPLRGHR